jgi:hypothetical protein
MARVFEKVVQDWLFDQFIDGGKDNDCWKLQTLIDELIYKDVIPRHIGFDKKLYKLLVMQIKRCAANLIDVPSEGYMMPQMIRCTTAPSFLRMNVEDSKKFEDLRHELESDTGVNIYYYHRIKSIAAKRPKRSKRPKSI